ncbi:MAG: S-layer homology domain-containing protein [Ruminiclostridium sp.]|nr:S-layer homology domain-containing protein [Ruminiclostridium sp.]
MKKLTAALLACVMLLGMAPLSLAAPTTQAIVDAALELIYSHEGTYNSINKNDNGAVSVGKIQWHGTRALALIKIVVNSNPTNAKSILGDTLYTEVTTVDNWSYRTVNDEEAAALATLLSTPEGKAAQDKMANGDITGYVTRGQKLGITDGAALVYFADLENQGGYGMSKRVATAAANTVGSFAAITLADIHQAGLADSVAGKYPTLRNRAYTYCQSLGFGGTAGVHFPKKSTYRNGMFPDVASSAWYAKSVAGAVQYGLMKGDELGAFRPNGTVTLAEVITMAARIHSIYTTGTEKFVQTSGKWYQVYLDYAYNKGIINKARYTSNVTLPATRAQFAEIFAKALPAAGLASRNTVNNNAIPDVKSSASYAEAVYTLYRAGVLTGTDAATRAFLPGSTITRAEAAAIASRMANSDDRVSFTLK